jgi:hypothetical protein
VAAARTKRTAQQPGRPSFLLRKTRKYGEPVIRPRQGARRGRERVLAGPRGPAGKRRARTQVGRRRGETGAEADGNEGVGGPRTSDEAG